MKILHTCPPTKMEQRVPKRRHIKFRRRWITQKKAYNIQNMAEAWSQWLFWPNWMYSFPENWMYSFPENGWLSVSILIFTYKPVVFFWCSRRSVVQLTLHFRGCLLFSAFSLLKGDMKIENCKNIASSEKWLESYMFWSLENEMALTLVERDNVRYLKGVTGVAK